jgi:hypothetical protein
MSTIRRQIMVKVGEVLAPLTALPGNPQLFENPDDAIEEGKLPAVVYAWTDDDIENVGHRDKHTLFLSVTAICKGADAEDDADELLIATHDLLFEGRYFDGLVRSFRRKATRREAAPEGSHPVILTQQYELDYWTKEGSFTEGA